MYVCMYVCMHVSMMCVCMSGSAPSLAHEQLDESSCSIFKSLSISGPYPVNSNTLLRKWGSSLGPQDTKRRHCLKWLSRPSLEFIHVNHIPKDRYNCILDIFRNTTVRTIGMHTQNVNFLQTHLYGPTDIIFVRSSATKNVLTSSNRFRLQVNVSRVQSCRRNTCNGFSSILLLTFEPNSARDSPVYKMRLIALSKCHALRPRRASRYEVVR